jgi:hypothetical protein
MVMIISGQPSQIIDYDRSKATGEVEYLKSLGSLITNCVIESRIAMETATKKKNKKKKKKR